MIKKALLPFLKGYFILLLSLLLLLIPFYQGTIALFEERQLDLISQSFQDGLNLLDHQFNTLVTLSSSLSGERWQSQARKKYEDFSVSDYYRIIQLQKDFQKLSLAQPYVSTFGILLKNHIYLTRERIYFPNQEYYNLFIRFGDFTQEEFFSNFAQFSGKSVFLPATDIYVWERGTSGISQLGVIWLCKLFDSASVQPTAVFVVSISKETIQTLLMPGLIEQEAGLTLRSKDNKVLLSFGFSEENSKAHVLTASASCGLTAELRISYTLFAQMMSSVRNFLLICLLAVLMVGAGIALLLAVRSSRPLQKLENLAKQVQSDPQEIHRGEKRDNSFEIIGQSLKNLASSVENYRQVLSLQQMNLQSHLFDHLLENAAVSEGETFRKTENDFQYCFPDFPSKYRIAILRFPEGAEPRHGIENLAQKQVAVIGLVESILSPTPYTHFRTYHAIMVLDSDCEVAWKEQLTLLHEKAQANFGMQVTIAVSEEAGEYWQLHRLYQETLHVLHFAEKESSDSPIKVWSRENFPDDGYQFPMDYSALTQLHQMLNRADAEGASSLIRNIGQRMMLMPSSEEVVSRQVYYNLRGVLLRLKIEKLSLLNSVDIPDYRNEIPLDKLLEQLISPCQAICTILAENANDNRHEFAVMVCQYIDENLQDGNMSEKTVADHFSISGPTLQKLIRQEKSTSFYDYVESQRYRLATELLTHTDLIVAQIAQQCGYNSINSFYKAFRRRNELTPAAYRNQAKSIKEEETCID